MKIPFGADGIARDGPTSLAGAIRLLVEEASRDGRVVRAAIEARRLNAAFPDSGLTPNAIADAILMAAASAGIPAEMGRAE